MGDVPPHGAGADEHARDNPSDLGSLRPGIRLGRYELLVPIARGGMARVWAARLHGQRGFQKLVAIKVILPHLAGDPHFERMFLDEARIASGVHHPNVCEIYELGEEGKTLYLAMEWVNGDSLMRVLRGGNRNVAALDPRVVARIVADACAGAHAAHELADDDGRALNVVHRDLSPHNILVSADGVSKVCDFGVAKALGQLHEQTSVGQLKGKASYMSPEQIASKGVDRRSDVFALGCVLYEATTGRRPFRGDADHLVMRAIVSGVLDPPSRVVDDYPEDLEAIVLRALQNQPSRRYPSAEEMRFALEEHLARGPLVTQSNVAQVVKARIGSLLERRRERIKQAQALTEPNLAAPESSIKPARPKGSIAPEEATTTLPLPDRPSAREPSSRSVPSQTMVIASGPLAVPRRRADSASHLPPVSSSAPISAPVSAPISAPISSSAPLSPPAIGPGAHAPPVSVRGPASVPAAARPESSYLVGAILGLAIAALLGGAIVLAKVRWGRPGAAAVEDAGPKDAAALPEARD